MTRFEHNNVSYSYNDGILKKQKQNFWNKVAWNFPPTGCLLAATAGPIIYEWVECKWTDKIRQSYERKLLTEIIQKEIENESQERYKKYIEKIKTSNPDLIPILNCGLNGMTGVAFSN